jgi:hypothetical protein
MVMMTLQDAIDGKFSKYWEEEANRLFHWRRLQDMGWISVTIDRLQDNSYAVDITYWLKENCQGCCERLGRNFLFENNKDAVLFILRWS